MHTPAAGHNTSSSAAVEDLSRTATDPSSSQGNKPDYYSNNPLFECLVCSRQVSSNRYATHLAKCMGMGSKGGRKGAARTAKGSAHSSTPNRFGTPKYSSDLDDDSFVKKSKLKGSTPTNGDKRALSPFSANHVANARISKKIKTSSPTPPPSDLLSGSMVRSHSSQPFAPSGLSNSTVLSGSPLNPLNNKRNNRAGSESALHEDGSATAKPRGRPSKSMMGSGNGNGTKRKRRDENDTDEDGEESFRDLGSDQGSDADFDVPDGDEDGEISEDDVALAVGTDSRQHSASKAADASDEEEEDDEDEEDDDDDDDEDDDNESVQLTSTRRQSSPDMPLGGAYGNVDRHKKTSTTTTSGGLQRERGSDGEFIDVESASEQSDNDSF